MQLLPSYCWFRTSTLNDQTNAGSEMMILWCSVRAITCFNSNAGRSKVVVMTSRMTWKKLWQSPAPVLLSTKYFISCHLKLTQASIAVLSSAESYYTTTKLSNSVLQWDRHTFVFCSSVEKFLQATNPYKSLCRTRCSNCLALPNSWFVLYRMS